jgi:hypothetical protein
VAVAIAGYGEGGALGTAGVALLEDFSGASLLATIARLGALVPVTPGRYLAVVGAFVFIAHLSVLQVGARLAAVGVVRLDGTDATVGATTAGLGAGLEFLPLVHFAVDWASMHFAIFFLVDIVTGLATVLGLLDDVAGTRALVLADAAGLGAGTPGSPFISDAVDWARIYVAKLGFLGGGAIYTAVLGLYQDLASASVCANAASFVACAEFAPLADLAVDWASTTVALLVIDEGWAFRTAKFRGNEDLACTLSDTFAALHGAATPGTPLAYTAVDGAINPFASTFLVKLGAADATVLGFSSDGTSAGLGAEATGGTAFSPLVPVRDLAVFGTLHGVAKLCLLLFSRADSAATSRFGDDDEVARAGAAAALSGALGPASVFPFTVDGHAGGVGSGLHGGVDGRGVGRCVGRSASAGSLAWLLVEEVLHVATAAMLVLLDNVSVAAVHTSATSYRAATPLAPLGKLAVDGAVLKTAWLDLHEDRAFSTTVEGDLSDSTLGLVVARTTGLRARAP